MQELQAALSLNTSQLAGVLRVARPTLYDWLRGREPNAANAGRVDTLLRILAQASVSSASPLNARFVARRVEIDAPSLIELLGEESLDEDRVIRAIERSRALADSASRRRTAREECLSPHWRDGNSYGEFRIGWSKNAAVVATAGRSVSPRAKNLVLSPHDPYRFGRSPRSCALRPTVRIPRLERLPPMPVTVGIRSSTARRLASGGPGVVPAASLWRRRRSSRS